MTKQLNKAIMNKSRTKNRYSKWPSGENFLELQKVKYLSKNLRWQKKQYFKSVSSKDMAAKK